MYKRGDVILCQVPMPSTGLTQSKLRPAIIVSKDLNNQRLSDVMIAPCTSNTTHQHETTQFLIEGEEIKNSGIRVPSVVKCEAFLTVPKALITQQLGQLSPSARTKLDSCLRDALAVG